MAVVELVADFLGQFQRLRAASRSNALVHGVLNIPAGPIVVIIGTSRRHL